jgi:hypothetical protein
MDDVQTRALFRQIAELLGCERRNILAAIYKLQKDVADLTVKQESLTRQLSEQ